METRTKIILLLTLLVTGAIVARLYAARSQPASQATTSQTQRVYESQENEGGSVTVTVTPLSLKPGLPASFDVAFETHSVDLLFDIEKVAALTDDLGTTYTPHWEGSPPGGHHRSGTLRFTPDIQEPTTLTLTFTDIAGIPSRTFSWNVLP